MKRWILGALTVVFLVSSAFAIEVFIDPPEARLMPGGTQAFTATAINDEGEIVPVNDWEWSLHPHGIGTIDDTGLLVASNHHGRGMVTASFMMDSIRYLGRAAIEVEPVRHHIIIRPRDAFLETSEVLQYEAWVVTNYGDSIGGLAFDWSARPDWLGEVSDSGLFVAGEQTGRGFVTASIDYEGHHLHGEGFVAVSELGWGGLAGLVTNDLAEPIPYANVELFIPPHRRPVHVTRTGEDGTYAFANLYPGSYIIRADARGFLPEFYDNSPTIEGATPVEVVGGAVTDGINFALAMGGIISGTVTAEDDEVLMNRSHVTAFCISPHAFHKDVHVERDGNYVITDLPPGTYIVRADAYGFLPEYWEEAAVVEDADSILIAAGTIVENINFTLASSLPESDGLLSGVVTDDSTGLPLMDAMVTLFLGGHHHPRIFQQLTDENGEFSFDQLPYGDYIVRSGAIGYLHEYYDNVPHWREATPLTVNETSSPEIAVALTPVENPGLCSFSGIIRDGNGNPLEGVLVRAQGSSQATAETGPDGRYYLTVAEGDYVLSADQASVVTRYYPNAEESGGATPLTIDPMHPDVEANFTLDEILAVNEHETSTTAATFKISSVYPNPFNATSRISFDVPQTGNIKLAVYDILGREVATLVDGMQSAGTQSVIFNASNLSTGIYFVQLSGVWGMTTHKIVLIK